MSQKTTWVYDCSETKENPVEVVKWLRRNFGERGQNWDFSFTQNSKIIITCWDDKLKFMYEVWKK